MNIQASPKFIVFIDFDGVTHPLPGRVPRSLSDVMMGIDFFRAQNVDQVNRLLESLDAVGVITSSWRLDFPWQDPHRFFKGRLIGQTTWIDRGTRIAEIELFLSEREWKTVPWVAVDDNARLFSADAPLIVPKADVGLTKNDVDRYLTALRPTGPN